MTTLHDPRHQSRRDPSGHRQPAARPAGNGPPASTPTTSDSDPADLLRGDRLALTVTEAGSLLGISRALAYELVARGELPSIRLGRRLVVPKVVVLRLLGLAPAEG